MALKCNFPVHTYLPKNNLERLKEYLFSKSILILDNFYARQKITVACVSSCVST